MKLAVLTLSLVASSLVASAQTPYNTISGTIWREYGAGANGIRETGEQLIPGVLVRLVNTTGSVEVASALSNSSGTFTLNNFKGNGTYRLEYFYPADGFTISASRQGSDNTLNSAANPGTASGNSVRTGSFTINSTTNLNTFGLGLTRKGNTITYFASKPSTPTDWTETFILPKSNDALYGVASKASVYGTNSSFFPTMGIENTSTTSGSTAQLGANGTLILTLPGTVPVTKTIIAATPLNSANLTVYDGTTDYGGTSGASFVNENASGDASEVYFDTDVDDYFRSSGPATFTIPAAVNRFSSFSGGGNIQAISQANSAAGVFVTYQYPTILPITLIYFNATNSVGNVLLKWKVGDSKSETDFTIERSRDGKNFTEIGRVAAGSGNKDLSYQYVDTDPMNGRNFYRLKQKDNSGETNYSGVAIVTFGKSSQFAAFPNPANATLAIACEADSKIELYNAQGQVVNVSVTRNGNHSVLNTLNLQAGYYVLQVTEGGVSKSQNIVIQHP